MKSAALVVLMCAAAQVVAQTSADTAKNNVLDTSAFVMHRSPMVATLLSTVVPGAGQVYNNDYIKIPFIWGICGVLLYEVIQNNSQYLHYKDLYQNSPDSNIRGSAQYFRIKEDYRDDRDYYGSFLFLAYVLNILDAYVGAHMFDFPVGGGTAHAALLPNVSATGARGIQLRIAFR